jgi:hypothetical protein
MASRKAACLAIGMVLAAASSVEAQGVAYTFDELRLLVRPGDTVSVADAAGGETTGRIIELTPMKLALQGRWGTRDVFERDVTTILQRRGDSLRNGALWGFGAGATLGFLAIMSVTAHHEGRADLAAIGAAFYGGLGAGIGVGVDALFQGRQVIYVRPAAGTGGLTVSPIVTRGRAGARVAFRF